MEPDYYNLRSRTTSTVTMSCKSKILYESDDEDEYNYGYAYREVERDYVEETRIFSFYKRVTRILEVVWRSTVNVICVPMYWLLVQIFVLEKWLLNRSPPLPTPQPQRRSTATPTRKVNTINNTTRTTEGIYKNGGAVPVHDCLKTTTLVTSNYNSTNFKNNYSTDDAHQRWAGMKELCWLLWIALALVLLGAAFSGLEKSAILDMMPSLPQRPAPSPLVIQPLQEELAKYLETAKIDIEALKQDLIKSSDASKAELQNFREDMTRNSEMTKQDLEALKIDLTRYLENTRIRVDSLKEDIEKYLETTQVDIDPLKEKLNTYLESTQVDIEGLRHDLTNHLEATIRKECKDCASMISTTVDQADVHKIVESVFAKYNEGKHLRADLALESAGGSIISTRCTKSSVKRSSVYTFFGLPFWHPPNNPRTIIQPGAIPGECWSFEGAEGYVVIQIISPAILTGFSLEHIPMALSPFGHIMSAPKRFEVVGLMDYQDPETEFLFGSYEYDYNGEPVQYFPVQFKSDQAFPFIELKVLSNHGSIEFTCVYRFQVHGNIVTFDKDSTVT